MDCDCEYVRDDTEKKVKKTVLVNQQTSSLFLERMRAYKAAQIPRSETQDIKFSKSPRICSVVKNG
jgi:hypothetical protein